jgi:SagB-type dehydrogenase family enzyme
MRRLVITTALILCGLMLFAQKNIKLPEPKKKGGMPLMETLSKRSTSRSFDTKSITQQQLSNLLWAAFGINRPDGKRTAPSSNNLQETEIYVLLKSGVYLWDPKTNILKQLSEEDVRSFGGMQDFVAAAPVQLILVGNISNMGYGTEAEKMNTAYIDAGYISQNIYLYCASEGLATGARAMIDKVDLAPKLKLKPAQFIVIAHCVGNPKQ